MRLKPSQGSPTEEERHCSLMIQASGFFLGRAKKDVSPEGDRRAGGLARPGEEACRSEKTEGLHTLHVCQQSQKHTHTHWLPLVRCSELIPSVWGQLE